MCHTPLPARIRRKFFDLHETNGSPVAAEALRRIANQQRVRKKIIERACKRSSRSDNQVYVGFLDIHHILGVETSDDFGLVSHFAHLGGTLPIKSGDSP
ncbi:MAG: hypothetical protein ABI188_06360 [Collimonas sp.]|uniref:hypothetical protein n=1 Tax=Collimonas sp. TaxID=1963772 RepID=UPI003265F5AC